MYLESNKEISFVDSKTCKSMEHFRFSELPKMSCTLSTSLWKGRHLEANEDSSDLGLEGFKLLRLNSQGMKKLRF